MVKEKTILSGIAASFGSAEGVVRVHYPGDDLTSFQDGDILVTTLTDPSMVSAMVKAAAIVTDIGGVISHPAILSREMGIPCVVNTKHATRVLENGMRVRVDGDNGKIYVLD